LAKSFSPNLSVVLAHYPVRNKTGDTITAAVTNLDLHDIARASRTFGVRSFYVVTPLADQQRLVKRIVAHWTDGFGGSYNPDRKEALGLIRVRGAISEVAAEIEQRDRMPPRIIATCARPHSSNIGFGGLREKLTDRRSCLLILGTAWGLTEDFLQAADYVLEPIFGPGTYNHLSVRSAASIILDRLIGSE
jgi:hypothetical protein